MNSFAYHWINSDGNFLHLLFDSEAMDGYPGRFRYIEYLVHAIYWKALAKGYLPRDFYDLFALLVTLVSCFLLLKIAKQKTLTHLETFVIVSLFILSTQSYLVALHNFRKAKFLASLWLILYLWAAGKKWKKAYCRKFIFLVIALIGFITDPFFILLFPVLAVGMDLSAGDRRFRFSRQAVLNFVWGVLAVVFLTCIIGPLFNEKSRIAFGNIEGVPNSLFKISNLKNFPLLFGDLLLPGLLQDKKMEISCFLLASFLCVLWYLKRKGAAPSGLCFSFIVSIPIIAFCVAPIESMPVFAGYYGHPVFILFLFSQIEILSKLRECCGPLVRKIHLVVLLLVLSLHQVGKPTSYTKWVNAYCNTPRDKDKYLDDYNELKRIVFHRGTAPSVPYTLYSDVKKIKSIALLKGKYNDQDNYLNRTDIAYAFIPTVFREELDDGLLKIEMEPVN